MGAWDQRPIYKSHARQLDSIRECEPIIVDELLRRLPEFFPTPTFVFMLDPTFEEQNVHVAIPENFQKFKIIKQYQIAGLLKNRSGRDLYWTAEQSGGVYLTPLGQFYRRLASDGRILTIVGVTGHQGRKDIDWTWVRFTLNELRASAMSEEGLSSLA